MGAVIVVIITLTLCIGFLMWIFGRVFGDD